MDTLLSFLSKHHDECYDELCLAWCHLVEPDEKHPSMRHIWSNHKNDTYAGTLINVILDLVSSKSPQDLDALAKHAGSYDSLLKVAYNSLPLKHIYDNISTNSNEWDVKLVTACLYICGKYPLSIDNMKSNLESFICVYTYGDERVNRILITCEQMISKKLLHNNIPRNTPVDTYVGYLQNVSSVMFTFVDKS